MFLKPMSEQLLQQWVSLNSWHEGHDNDTRVFYRFIHAYVEEHGYELDEALLREKILFILDRREDDDFQRLACERVGFMRNVLDYLQFTKNL